MLLKVCQHGRLEPPTGPEAPWPSQTHFFDDYQGEISRAVAHWLCVRACMCVSERDSLLSYGLTADCMHCYSHYTPITSEDMQHAAARHVRTDQNLPAWDLNIASPAALWACTAGARVSRYSHVTPRADACLSLLWIELDRKKLFAMIKGAQITSFSGKNGLYCSATVTENEK